MKLATLCYVKKDRKTLMLHRVKIENDFHKGKWNGLGGKMHMGETPEECVMREVKEESGLTITNPSLRGILTFPAFREEEDWYAYVFIAREFSGSLIDSPEGQLEWIDDTKLTALEMWEGDPVFMKCLDREEFFSAKFSYQNGKLVDHNVVVHDWSLNGGVHGTR
jgi:8-oxo-dGTP diphosphatase